MEEKDRLDQITDSVIGAAIKVHRALGPGLLESAYEACLAFELAELRLRVPFRTTCQILSLSPVLNFRRRR
ncbi:MAG: GxxExxY protein [Phycisphaerae bacterium]|nr:GxxExxY protein [Phycisphaerae bacterium]